MLVGPSPGRAGEGERDALGGAGRPMDSNAKIGANAGAIDFRSNKGRSKRWRMLNIAIFGNAEYASALTTVANLDWGNNANQRDIPQDHLEDGCVYVYDVMRQTKPRIVVTLTKRTWNVLSKYLLRSGYTAPKYDAATSLESLLVILPGVGSPTLILRAPQHPSQPFFTAKHANKIAQEVQHFLQIEANDQLEADA